MMRKYEYFEQAVLAVLTACGYVADLTNPRGCRYDIDAYKQNKHLRIECKLSLNAARSYVLIHAKESDITTLVVPFKAELLSNSSFIIKCENRIDIWDIYDLQKMLEKCYRGNKDAVTNAFVQLSNFSNEFFNIKLVSGIISKLDHNTVKEKYALFAENKTRGRWRLFEQFIESFVQYYFQNYIGELHAQRQTDSSLHRYDFIAPIATEKTDSFFMEIIRNCFNCRYLVFEAKCYRGKISQDEIWRTSKYLYKNALRSVALVFATSECDDNAIKTQQGLLREQGKLIIVIDGNDIQNLIADDTIGIDEILKEKLDNLMMGINA